MKITLMENGVDSLKKGVMHLKKYEELYFINKEGKERYLELKDAILNIHHGIEIMLKQVLMDTNELLIFSEIGRDLKNAFFEKRQKKLSSIFETTFSPHTVTLEEAVDRMQKICGHSLSIKFADKIKKLDHYRNQITHSAVNLEEAEINDTFNGIIDEIDIFFSQCLGQKYQTVTGYTDLKENYAKYLEEVDEKRRAVKKEVTEKLIEAFGKCSISMGANEVRAINDIDIATKLLTVLTSSKLRFGTDLYNGYCSGNVNKIKRISDNRFSLFTADNHAEYRFKFKTLLLFLPPVETDMSPILFFEADDTVVDKKLQASVEVDYHGRKKIDGLFFVDEKKYEWDQETISEFYNRIDYDDSFTPPNFWHVTDFLDKGIFCFLNIQGLRYGSLQKILKMEGSLKQLEVVLRTSLEKNKK